MYEGKTKLVLRHLAFLVDKFGFNYVFHTFKNYKGFYGPSDTYSFYNSKGCVTLHHLVQKGEWGIYVSSTYTSDQYSLLDKQIPQDQFLEHSTFLSSGFIKQVEKSIKQQIVIANTVFGVPVN